MIFRGEFGGGKAGCFCELSRELPAFLFSLRAGRVPMATYVSLVNFTEEGARHIRHTTERAKGLINAAANLGIKSQRYLLDHGRI